MALPASDPFTRADNPIGSNWTDCLDVMYVRSNRAGGITTGANHCAFWSADSFANDQYSEIVLKDIGHYGGCWAAVRCATGANFYAFHKNFFTGNAKLYKWISGTQTELVDFGVLGNDLDTFRIEIVGTTITCKLNGSQVGSNYTGATELTTGAAGCGNGEDHLGSMVDSWTGGNMTAAVIAIPVGVLRHTGYVVNPSIPSSGTVNARIGGNVNGAVNGRVA